MSLNDPPFTKLILEITLRLQLLVNLVLADRFLLRANLPAVLQVSRLVNQRRSTRVLSVINVRGMDISQVSVRVKAKPS